MLRGNDSTAKSFPRWRAVLAWLGLALLLAGCVEAPTSRDTPSLLDARGEGARIVSYEFWLLTGIGTAIVLLVTAILILILLRHRRTPPDAAADLRPVIDREDRPGHRWIWLGGIALPLVVLLLVFGVEVRTTWMLTGQPRPTTTTIRIVGHRWWWEIQYLDYDFKTANQLVIPAGETVQIETTSPDVIHSFWVPQLHYKRDLIPGQVNVTWFKAEEPGVYRGVCAEFCGTQHAQMHLMVVALAPDRFQAWLDHESQPQPAQPPDNALAQAGQQVFLGSSCVFCHTIRGTPAAGEVGPELTHLASRLTLAAGVLDNNVGNLGGWIMDPQHIKPGSLMPPGQLTGEELQALLAYLGTLQ